MLEFLRVRLQQGTRTSPFPVGGADFPARFRGRPSFDSAKCDGTCPGCAGDMPSEVLTLGPRGVEVDVGASLFAPEEAAACTGGALTFTQDHRMSSRSR